MIIYQRTIEYVIYGYQTQIIDILFFDPQMFWYVQVLRVLLYY